MPQKIDNSKTIVWPEPMTPVKEKQVKLAKSRPIFIDDKIIINDDIILGD